MSQNVELHIALPLPIDITGTLIKIIGLTWPGTVIKDGGAGQLVLGIPVNERHKNAKRAAQYAKVKKHLDALVDVDITELDTRGGSFGIPEYLAAQYTTMAREAFNSFPEAKNYLETVVTDRETSARYVFYAARSEGQTPHALREKAEADLERVRGERDALRAQLQAAGLAQTDSVVDISGLADDSETQKSSGAAGGEGAVTT